MGVGFTLRKIITEQFATFPEYLDINQVAQVIDSFEFFLHPDNKQVGIFASFEFKQKGRTIMKIVVSCHFEIDSNVWNGFLGRNQVQLPLDFSTNLLAITAGTTRGILSSKTEHTPFSNFILPLLNLHGMIEEEVIFLLD